MQGQLAATLASRRRRSRPRDRPAAELGGGVWGGEGSPGPHFEDRKGSLSSFVFSFFHVEDLLEPRLKGNEPVGITRNF